MSSPIWYALGAMLFNGLTDYVFKTAAAGSMRGDYKMHQFIVAQSVLFWAATMLYGVAAGELRAGPHIWLGLLAGVFMFTGFNCFAWSLRHGNVSVNAPIFRLNFLVTAALAIILLGEPPLPVKLAGLALALAAIWLLIGAGKDGFAGLAPDARRSLLLAVAATLALGTGNTIHKVGLSIGGTPATQLATHSFVYLALSAVIAIRADRGLQVPAAVLPVAFAGAVVGAFAFIFMMRGLALGEASVIVPIAQMGFVVSAAMGVLLLGERMTLRKWAGLSAAIAALGALAMS